MKIIFMGTPEFGVKVLCELIKNGHEIVSVFTGEDKPFGRKQILKFSEIKQKALEFGLKVFQPKKFAQKEIELVRSLKADIIVVVAFGKILPKSVLDSPKYGSLNIHASLLPKYRGASPIQASIINCDDETGITIMEMEEKLDSGRIVKQSSIKIGVNETADELSKRLSNLGAKLICEVLKEVEKTDNNIKKIVQDEKKASYVYKITKEMGRIDFTKSSLEVHKLICGLSSKPAAYCFLGGRMLKIYKSVLEKEYFGRPGEVLDEKRFVVSCGSGAVRFFEVKLEGRKKMAAKDFLNGYNIKKGIFLE